MQKAKKREVCSGKELARLAITGKWSVLELIQDVELERDMTKKALWVTIWGMLSLVLVGCASMAPDPVPESERSLVQVVPVEGMNASEIYVGLRSWVAENFRSAKSVIEYDNPDQGVLIGNGNIPVPCSGVMDCYTKSSWTHPFTMKIEVKNGKFRVTYSNIRLFWPASSSGPAHNALIQRLSMLNSAKAELAKLTVSMTESLKKDRSNDDW